MWVSNWSTVIVAAFGNDGNHFEIGSSSASLPSPTSIMMATAVNDLPALAQ